MAQAGSETVALVLVSHSGRRWLPAVLDGIAEQTLRPTATVAVDTGSKDGSADLLRERLGDVVTLGRRTSYADAVAAGVEHLTASGVEPVWLWLLHDDSRPAPSALAELIAAARDDPTADILGPKLREWPSLKHLLELGVTISGTGRRETGLEPGEYDQGQHDQIRPVLAVNTAGMLVRTSVWRELGGFDSALPVFGNDLDFGWRAANAGHSTIVVPDAVVFHAEAAHRGLRRTSLTGRHTHFQERRAALFTLLANTPGRLLPWQLVRLTFGTFWRVVGFLLVRAVGEAADEAAAWFHVLARPAQVRAARRSRAAGITADPAAVRGLLAPWWLPYRHGLDNLSNLVEAVTNQAADVAERRRAAAAADLGPGALPAAARHHRSDLDALDEDDDELEPDSGLLARYLTSPVALGLTALLVALLVGSREAWGRVSGGGLSPAPLHASDWWQLYVESVHPLALGSDVVAPAYVAILGLLGSLLGGSAAAAVSALLLCSMPVALWGAWRLLRVIGRFLDPQGAPRWLLAAGAGTYAVVPAVSGAWGNGRLGPVVATALLPWFAHAVLGFADPESERRWRAAWRSGLLLTILAAFAPVIFVFAALLTVLVFALALAFSRALLADRSVSLPPVVAILTPVVLLVPWWLPLLTSGEVGGLLLEPGRLPPATADAVNLLLGRLDGGAPAWFGLPLVVAAVGALLHPRSRTPAALGWLISLTAAASGALVSAPLLDLRAASVRPSAASLLPVLTGALVVAALSLGMALVHHRWGGLQHWRNPLGALLIALALAGPALGCGWFVATGSNQLGPDADPEIPAYMRQSSLEGPAHGVLIIRGTVADGLTYLVRRGDGVTLGEDEILALTRPDPTFVSDLQAMTTRPAPAVVARLADSGVEYIVMPEPADGQIAAQLDATSGLSQASAENRSTRAWHVDQAPTAPFTVGGAERGRVILLLVQGIAALVVLVLCGPSNLGGRRRNAAERQHADAAEEVSS